MPGETAPLAQSNPSIAPKKKSNAVGKAAVAKVTLLDGSELDVTIDVIIIIINHYFLFDLIFDPTSSILLLYTPVLFFRSINFDFNVCIHFSLSVYYDFSSDHVSLSHLHVCVLHIKCQL